MIDQAFSAHTNAIITDDQLSFSWECFYIDNKISTWLIFESLFLQGIRSIGKEFPNENLAISIEGFSNDI